MCCTVIVHNTTSKYNNYKCVIWWLTIKMFYKVASCFFQVNYSLYYTEQYWNTYETKKDIFLTKVKQSIDNISSLDKHFFRVCQWNLNLLKLIQMIVTSKISLLTLI